MTAVVRYLGGTGLALWALVMTLEPDVGFRAPWPWMALFWLLQIGIGLAVLQALLRLVSRLDRAGRWPLWSVVLTSGALGALLLTPVYWLIGEGLMQQVLGFPLTPDGETGPDEQRAGSVARALLQELGDIAGPVIAAWALICWPRLQRLVPPLVAPHDPASFDTSRPACADVPGMPGTPDVAPGIARPAWRSTLPPQLGDDLIAVKSELQYLRVRTSRGSALVLGSLQDVEEGEGRSGLRVHRSWWVHADHVVCVRRRGDGAVCELSDGTEVPVSRRRRTEILARFGDGARYDAPAQPPERAAAPEGQNVRRTPT